ncbi:MAG TPA: universal stress protein [Herpetosiphonaceae bacterium]
METQKRQIIVPLDGSALAEAVLPHAVALARATESGLTLLRVVTPTETMIMLPNPTMIPPVTAQRLFEEEHTQSQIYLNTVAKRLHSSNLEIRTAVLVGIATADAIVTFVRHMPDTALIAMATHGHTGLRHLIMGSVAEHVLHTTPVPLLLVRSDEQEVLPYSVPTYHSIIVPLDGSAFAEQALPQARSIAIAMDTDLILVGVGPTIDDVALADGGIEPAWMLTECQAEDDRVAAYLNDRAAQIRREGVRVRATFVRGEPADQILRVSDDERAGLIVMTTHGRSGLSRLWLGSVARSVVQDAMVPVLLVRAQEPVLERAHDHALEHGA